MIWKHETLDVTLVVNFIHCAKHVYELIVTEEFSTQLSAVTIMLVSMCFVAIVTVLFIGGFVMDE